MTDRKLTLPEAIRLNGVLDAAQRCARVARLDDDGNVTYGTARHLTRHAGDAAYITNEDDVRDTFLRVTTTAGWEVWWPVADLAEEFGEGTFAVDVEPPR
jgi:hypothetical protein